MKKLVFTVILLLLASSTYGYNLMTPYKAQDYKFHKETFYIKVHWNIARTDSNTIVAKGFVEPYNYDYGLRGIQLELVGLDDQGNVVNSSSGTPKFPVVEHTFYPGSPFSISMKLNGREKEYTITGSYFYNDVGRMSRSEHIDYIPIK